MKSATGSNLRYTLSVILVIFLVVFATLLKAGPFGSRRSEVLMLIRKKTLETKYAPILDFILTQSRLETGDFTSRLFKEHNNLFGMKNATAGRKFTQLGYSVPGSDFRKYDSLAQSVEDYIQLLNFNSFPINIDSLGGFATKMKLENYYEETSQDYLNGLKKYYVP